MLFPHSLVNQPISVDGVAYVPTPPLLFSNFNQFFHGVYFVAICTATAERVPEPTKELDVNVPTVCNYIRVAIMEILRKFEQFETVEKAIHETGDISVPHALLYSTGDFDQPKRLLPVPRSSTFELEKNQRLVKEFFLEHVHCLGSAQNIELFAIELIGDEGLRNVKQNMDRQLSSHRELIFQVFQQWKLKMGKNIGFVPLIEVFEKLEFSELKDRCLMFVQEHSFCFTLHQLHCNCFIEE